jgi:hypothetical protein
MYQVVSGSALWPTGRPDTWQTEAFGDWMRGVTYFGTTFKRRLTWLHFTPSYRYIGGRMTGWSMYAKSRYGTVDAFDTAASRWWAGLI